MMKSAEVLMKKLEAEIESGRMKKAAICRDAGFSPSQLDAYLKGNSTPGMDAMDRIAKVLGQVAWEAIRPGEVSVPTANRDLIDYLATLDDEEAAEFVPGVLKMLKLSVETRRRLLQSAQSPKKKAQL